MSDEASRAARQALARAARIGVLALALAGCAQPARETFDLAGPIGAARGAAPRAGAALAVSEPTAVAPTSSDRVVVRDSNGSVAVLPGVQWSERLPRLFQDRLIEALQRAGVSASRFNAAATRTLSIDIRRFEIDVSRNVATVEIAARIVEDANGVARATKVFLAETPTSENTGAPAVHALGSAAADVAGRLAIWARNQV